MCRWMNVKAFGTPNPGPDAQLTGSGSSSLEFMKKAISFYMPIKDNWNPELKRGNPTRSKEVKEVMHRVIALGGKKKKEEPPYDDSHEHYTNGNLAAQVPSDGPRGLLQRTCAQNNEFINILSTMGSALRTFTRSVDQMKNALEMNNHAIRHELTERSVTAATAASTESNEVFKDSLDGTEKMEEGSGGEAVDVPNLTEMENAIRECTAEVQDTLQSFIDSSAVNSDMKILIGADGYCTFSNSHGKQVAIPDGFTLPSVDLVKAWRHWIIGFPDFKVKSDSGDIIDAPIRPLRLIDSADLPQSLKKKYKDGWRPILCSMTGDVSQMLETTPITAMDEKFVQETYNMAMAALHEKAPGIFSENADKSNTWKVATWSRKVRENNLGPQQVKNRQYLEATPLKTEEEAKDDVMQPEEGQGTQSVNVQLQLGEQNVSV